MGVIITFIFYFLVFAVFHSLLATNIVKSKAKSILGTNFRFFRLIYTLASFIAFAPALIIWILNSGSTRLVYVIPMFLFPLIILFRIAAIGFILYAAMQIDILGFIGLRQILNKQYTNDELITNGAYGIIRHPQYVGAIILFFTKMEVTQLDLIAILLFSAYFIIGAFIEERRLTTTFGDEYRKYQHRVPMFIPFKR